MSERLSKITADALRLPQQEQWRLARTLLEQSEAVGDLGVDEAWDDEIERRIKLLDAGLAKGRPFAAVLREVDRQLAS